MPTIAALGVSVFAFFAAALVVPLAIAVISADWLAFEAFLVIGVVYGFLATLAAMALSPRIRRLNRTGMFSASITMWCALVLAAMPPFIVLEHQSLSTAFFEAASAAVTLGVTPRPLSTITATMASYRSMLAWQGGLLTLLLAVYVLGRSEVGGTANQHLRLVLHSSSSGTQRLRETFLEVFIPYTGMTLLCALLLMWTQVSPQNSINLALSMISTSGFVPFETGASVLQNLAGEAIMLLFMVIGATSILWHRAIMTRKWRLAAEQVEAVWFLIAILIFSAIAVLLASAKGGEDADTLQRSFTGIFDVISIMTTTGITHDQRTGIALPVELVFGLAIVGGCAFSTSGGIKFFRFGSMLHHSANELKLLVYPHAILVGSVNATPKDFARAKAVWSTLFLSVLVIVAATLMFSLMDFELHRSLGLAIGAFSSTGNLVMSSLATQTGAPPSELALALLAIVSIIARIELLVVLAIFGRSKW